MGLLEMDKARYKNEKMPGFQKWYRRSQKAKTAPVRYFCKAIFGYLKNKSFIDFSDSTLIGGGLYLGHPVNITINPNTKIGNNVNIHKGVTIGRENRGKRVGCPVIGNEVWIGINATIVGAVTIGDDVLIAPNSFVNCDVPSHSVVIGNPCIIKHVEHATEGYVNNLAEISNK